MTYLVAVSGGVDSVVLLDMLAQGDDRLIVAHVDHGIRDDSAADARFVAALAKKYDLPFVSTRYELGASASEETARRARYDFLHDQAEKFQAKIVTAHHQGDVIETIAINLARGTGWRGLAVLGSDNPNRPLLPVTKAWIYEYALAQGLEWVEDSTNSDSRYLRNRIRKALARTPVDTVRIMQLRATQLQLRKDVRRESMRLAGRHAGSRHFLGQLDQETAIELLGYEIEQVAGVRPVRPQLVRALLAVKTFKPGTVHHVGDRVILTFTARKYRVSVL